PAGKPPRLALDAVHLRVETDVVARLHHLLAAEPAAEATGPTGIRPQRVALDQQRILCLDLLGGAVVGVAIVHGDRRAIAVACALGPPAAANQAAKVDIEAVVARAAAVDTADH